MLDDQLTAAAFSGVTPGADVGAVQTSGTATYSGDYELEIVDAVFVLENEISARLAPAEGTLSLNADFGAGTLTGGGSGGGFGAVATTLDVNGTISGRDISGTVDITHTELLLGVGTDELSGPLTGLIGEDAAIGAFHASDSNTAAAGGFVATAD